MKVQGQNEQNIYTPALPALHDGGFFPASCGRMFHPKSLLLLNSSGISLCIQEKHQNSNWLSRSNQSTLVHFSESSACCTKTRIQSPLTSGSPGGGPPSTIFAPSWLCLLTFIRVGKNVQKSNVAGRTQLVQSLLLSIFTDFFSFLFILILTITSPTFMYTYHSRASSDSEGLGQAWDSNSSEV